MTPDEVSRRIQKIRIDLREKFVAHPGYVPFRAALDELRKQHPLLDRANDFWGEYSPRDCEMLVEAGADGEQIIAIATLCFNLVL